MPNGSVILQAVKLELTSVAGISASAERCVVREHSAHGCWIVAIELQQTAGIPPVLRIQASPNTDDALICPGGGKRIVALRERCSPHHPCVLRLCCLDTQATLACQQVEALEWWRWVSPSTLGLVTPAAVYHWSPMVLASPCPAPGVAPGLSPAGARPPVLAFARAPALAGSQIVSYRTSADGRWALLVGLLPGPLPRPQLPRGILQLHSYAQKSSQRLEAHAAAFACLQVPGQSGPTNYLVMAQKLNHDNQITAKLRIIELGVPSGSKRQAELQYPRGFEDDYPVSLQVSSKYHLVFTATKFGLLWVHDLRSATALQCSRISQHPVSQALSSPHGGLYVYNSHGQVLSIRVDEAVLAQRRFPSRSNNSVPQQQQLQPQQHRNGFQQPQEQAPRQYPPQQLFEQLLAAGAFKEAAEVVHAHPPLRTMVTLERFKAAGLAAPLQAQPHPPAAAAAAAAAAHSRPITAQKPPLLVYFAVLLSHGSLGAEESVELARLLDTLFRRDLLKEWWEQGKLAASLELAQLLNTIGAGSIALEVYQRLGLGGSMAGFDVLVERNHPGTEQLPQGADSRPPSSWLHGQQQQQQHQQPQPLSPPLSVPPPPEVITTYTPGWADQVDDQRITGATSSQPTTQPPSQTPRAPAQPPSAAATAASASTAADSNHCVICLAAPKECRLKHGSTVHVCVCRRCSQKIGPGDNCILCRQPIEEVLFVY